MATKTTAKKSTARPAARKKTAAPSTPRRAAPAKTASTPAPRPARQTAPQGGGTLNIVVLALVAFLGWVLFAPHPGQHTAAAPAPLMAQA